jgi:bifunctional non-homologous end joining protein LigD
MVIAFWCGGRKIACVSIRVAVLTSQTDSLRIVNAVRNMKIRSIFLDGEAVICDANGLAQFDLVHSKANDDEVKLIAFDLLEIDGEDLRTRPLGERKAKLQRLLRSVKNGIEFSEHLTGAGWAVYEHACKLGCEGIVAKRIDLGYESGRSKRWLKIKNPDSPASRRAEEVTF